LYLLSAAQNIYSQLALVLCFFPARPEILTASCLQFKLATNRPWSPTAEKVFLGRKKRLKMKAALQNP